MEAGSLVFVSFRKCCWLSLAWGEVRSRLFMGPSLCFVGGCCCGWMTPPLSFGSISLVMQHDCAASTSKRRILTSPRFFFASSLCRFADKAHRRCLDIGPEPDCRFHKDNSSVSSRWMETGRETLLEPQSLLCRLRHLDCFLDPPFAVKHPPPYFPNFDCRADHAFQSRWCCFHPHSRPRLFLDSASNPMIDTKETNIRSDTSRV